MRASPGVTLIEVLVATAVLGILLLVAMMANLQPLQIEKELRRLNDLTRGRLEAALATLHVTKAIEVADRVFIDDASPTHSWLQVRKPLVGSESATAGCRGRAPDPLVPPASCLNDPLNYRWDQYWLDETAHTLQFYGDTRDPVTGSKRCTTRLDLAHDIYQFQGYYLEVSAPPPPGGEPFDELPPPPTPQENNVINFRVDWNNGLPLDDPNFRSLNFVSEAVPRNIGYTDVGASNASGRNLGDSGRGLDVVSPPPIPCGV